MFDAFVPFSLAAFPAAFFIACGRPNHERSSPPLPTVLLLLTGEHLEEGGGVKNERTGSLGCGHLRGLFLSFAIAVRFLSPPLQRLLINEFNLRPAQCRALLIAAMAGDEAEKPARSGERNSPAR